MRLSRHGLIVGQIGSNRLRLVQVLLWARARSRARDGRAHGVPGGGLGRLGGKRQVSAVPRRWSGNTCMKRIRGALRKSPRRRKRACQLRPKALRNSPLALGQATAGAVGVERQRRHGRLIRHGYAPPASFGGAFERRAISAGLALAKTLRLRSSAPLSRGLPW
jgi:hypothetical protein